MEKIERDAKRIEKITTEEIPRRPHDPALHHELALLLFSQGQTAEAVQWLYRALSDKPSYLPAHGTLAEYYQQTGEPERATYHRRFLPTRKHASSGQP